MEYETLKKELLKQARNAFERASTLRETQRLEVYTHNSKVITSDVLEEEEEILYTPEKLLCYQVYGHNYLEDEIKTWIDYARTPQKITDELPFSEPTDIEKSIRELANEIAKTKALNAEDISSYEIFANLPVTLLGSIEQEIIEYWWNAKEEENAKKLALIQIEAVIGSPK
jgi:hypothetical protein